MEDFSASYTDLKPIENKQKTFKTPKRKNSNSVTKEATIKRRALPKLVLPTTSNNMEQKELLTDADRALQMAKSLQKWKTCDLKKIGGFLTLASLPVPSVLQIVSIEQSTGAYGNYYILTYLDNSTGANFQKVVCPSRVVESFNVDNYPSPFNILYLGEMENSKKPETTYYNVKRISTKRLTTMEATAEAEKLRKMSEEELKLAYDIDYLSNFKDCSIFAYIEVVERFIPFRFNGEESIVNCIRYVAEKNGKRETRTLLLPIRYNEEAKRCAPGVMIYKGKKQSKNGNPIPYHNVVFISSTNASDWEQYCTQTNSNEVLTKTNNEDEVLKEFLENELQDFDEPLGVDGM